MKTVHPFELLVLAVAGGPEAPRFSAPIPELW